MHILDIPTEIKREIFFHSGSQNLLQCALVCKSWNVTALLLLYNEMMFNASRVYLTKQQLKMNANERDGYFKYGPFIKSIIFDQDDENTLKNYLPKGFNVDSLQKTDCEFDKDAFILLLEYLPNLQNLYIGNSANVNKYFQYILDTESNKCLNQIQIISSVPKHLLSQPSYSDNIHFAMCYKYRATITTLHVNYKQIVIDLGSQSDKTLTFLSHFTKLTHLKLCNTCDDHLTTFDIQKVYPYLTSLYYYSSKGIPDVIVENILNNPANFNLESNLKSLSLRVPTIPVNYVRYITDYLSTRFDTLDLQMYDVDLYDWIYGIGMDNALKFARRLSTAKISSFSCTSDEESVKKSTSYKSKMTIFFELVNAFKGDKDTFCRVDYCDFQSLLCNSLDYNLKDGLRLGYGLEYTDYYRPNETNVEQDDQEHQSPHVVEIVLPDIATSIIGPEIINYMNISMWDTNPELPYKFLEYALSHCPNLEYFEFEFWEEPCQHFCIATDINGHEIRGNNHISSKSTKENLKVIKAVDYIPSKELLNLVSTYLPNIEFVACVDPGYEITIPMMTEIDFTAFKNLKTFCFVIELTSGGDADHTFIHLKYSDGDEAYYCQSKENSLALIPATWELLQKCNNNEKLDTRSITIKCNKDLKLVVCSDMFGAIAEFDNGNLLDYISINSNFLDKDFL